MAERKIINYCTCHQEHHCDCLFVVNQGLTDSQSQSFNKLIRVYARVFQFVKAAKGVLAGRRLPRPYLQASKAEKIRVSDIPEFDCEELEKARKFLLVRLWLQSHKH